MLVEHIQNERGEALLFYFLSKDAHQKKKNTTTNQMKKNLRIECSEEQKSTEPQENDSADVPFGRFFV